MSPLQNKTDPEHLLALQQDNESALQYFFNQYYDALVYFAFDITKDIAVAEEISSDAFLKLWHHRDQFFKVTSLKAYLYRVVKNASIDFNRVNKVAQKNEHGYQYLTEPTEKAIEEKIIAAETYALVLAALEAMPAGYQKVFRGIYLEGKSYEELAQEMDTNTVNIRNQKFKAILFLRKKIPLTILLMLFFI
ncbi:RNA polymerase sigma factor [Pinibacter soli]|uniref:Sigma-70 family RNA polymerase sigma factor n=1 Tax=Pinibacter soli TaxID=3044211 RepID=A0ABT6RFP1_9BACT|nr:sigma-70 family RNA polymerase sigma factor [Pinibacter soli]MDI3321378.1 sigma-70 family RNA polymerase sigma factor [Pinibacter soli]